MLTRRGSSARSISDPFPGKSPAFVLLGVLFALCWLAGGASRADVGGQALVRSGAWAILIAAIIICPPLPWRSVRAVALLLLLSTLLAVLQLIPLPPGLWQALSGRNLFVEAAAASGQPQPWRPWAIVPGAAANALGSLIVPATVLVLVAGLTGRARAAVPSLVLAVIGASMMLGLLQAAGTGFDNPLINGTLGEVSGSFANRNHFALFLAMGCLIAPVWAFANGQKAGWRTILAAGLVLLFALTILASGSRAGMALGALGIGLGLLLAREGIRRTLRHMPRWVGPALLAAMVAVVVGFVALAVFAGRAESISRAISLDAGEDMRGRGLPVVLMMIRTYLPFGSGLGSFEPMFRLHEPFALLKPTYFNHAHNDYLEIVLDAGVPGLLLLAGAIGWWAWASIRAWRRIPAGEAALPRLGSAMILLILLASVFDYPARTPMIMAILVVAAIWLSAGRDARTRSRDSLTVGSALPRKDRHL